MQPKIIKSEEQYEITLGRIEELMDALPETNEGNELELLVTLVEMYEKKQFAIDCPDAISAIEFRMEQMNLIQKDLVPYIGNKSKVSEILSGKRNLTLKMIRKLHNGLGIPVGILLQKPGAELPELLGLKEMVK